MPEIRISPSSRQQRLLAAAVLTGAVVLPAATWIIGADARFLVIGPAVFIAVMIFHRPRLLLTPHACAAKGGRSVSYPWAEIRDISVRTGKNTRTVVLTTHDGKERTLPVPLDGRSLPDPEFDGKVRTLTECWHARRGWTDATERSGHH
jgi:hypothetical protein